MGVTSAWSPMGNFLEGQAHPNLFAFHRTMFFYFLWYEVFCVCFPVVQGFSMRLLCLFSNSFQFKFFIYSLYIHIYIFYIFFHCTVGSGLGDFSGMLPPDWSSSTHFVHILNCLKCILMVSLWHPGDGRDVRKKPLPYNIFFTSLF